jgi:hypothetical protein
MSLVFPTQYFDSTPLSAFGLVSTSPRQSPGIDPSFGEILEKVGELPELPAPTPHVAPMAEVRIQRSR